jgi:hypothetical protein
MDGLWSTGNPDRQESIQQARMNRFRLLRFNTDVQGADDMSGFAAQDPTAAPLNVNVSGGPHFALSPETADGKSTTGFEFGLLAPTGAAVAAAGDFTVTIWRLVESTMQQAIIKQWLAMTPLTGVGYNQLFRSFDTDTGVFRFQITNIAAHGSIVLAYGEL